MKVSVIVPTLNEEEYISACLQSVLIQEKPFGIIVADGDSTDETRTLARSAARIINSPRGRARQMNAGAATATGDILLFLHADTRLPDGAFGLLRAAMADPAVTGGCFRVRFDAEGSVYRFFEVCTRLKWHRMCLGDRAIFVRKSVFEALLGYPDVTFLEDILLARAMRSKGRLCYLSLPVTTSGRRFEKNGRIRQQIWNLAIWTAFQLGVSPGRLEGFYQKDNSVANFDTGGNRGLMSTESSSGTDVSRAAGRGVTESPESSPGVANAELQVLRRYRM